MIGSVYEVYNIKSTDFPLFTSKSRFTDDTVITIAVASAILKNTDYITSLKDMVIGTPMQAVETFLSSVYSLLKANPIIDGAMDLR